MGLEAPRCSLLLWGSLEFTHRGSQTLQERERGGDDVCGVLRPDGAKAAEPEHPTGELGGRGQDTEFGVWPPCPHISPSPHPQELTWSLSLPPTPPTLHQGPERAAEARACDFSWRKSDFREPLQREARHPTRYTHHRESLLEVPPETGSPQKDPRRARGAGGWSAFPLLSSEHEGLSPQGCGLELQPSPHTGEAAVTRGHQEGPSVLCVLRRPPWGGSGGHPSTRPPSRPRRGL